MLDGRVVKFNPPLDPTLVPNFNRGFTNTNSNGLSYESPTQTLETDPRVNGSALLVIGGTITAGDIITVTFNNNTIQSSPISALYKVLSTDTTETIAQGLATSISALSEFAARGAYAESSGSDVNIFWPGPVSGFTTITKTVSGSATETVTITQFSGGSGSIIPFGNFNFTFNNSISTYWFGQPTPVDFPVLSALVADGMPIY